MKRLFRGALLAACGMAVACGGGPESMEGSAATSDPQSLARRGPGLVASAEPDTSPPLRELPAVPPSKAAPLAAQRRHIPLDLRSSGSDPVVQSHRGPSRMPAPKLNRDGMGFGFTGPQGHFPIMGVPPDPDGDVGPHHYVQIVNLGLTVFDKSGTALLGPIPTSSLWYGFGTCAFTNDGDGVVRYDRLADRWILTQFSVSGDGFFQCVAVSKTGDPTGRYTRYAFQFDFFNDYPKLALWPDAYYLTANLFTPDGVFMGGRVCALDRVRMLSGAQASMQCFDTAEGGLIASDLDGHTRPPAGAPDPIFALETTRSLAMWKLHVDWHRPGNSSLNGPVLLPVAPFTPLCGGGTCVPQPGTPQELDSLGDRLMNRAPYRNFGGHQSVLLTHSVEANGGGGMRWYEIRDPDAPTVHQQGTYAPDSLFRWMGSLAFDRSGDIALGYSVSDGTVYPSVRYTGRLASDPPGLMARGEATLVEGSGSQQGAGSSFRWGDYSSMNIDPSDDCTFWYTQEYLAMSGAYVWKTRIGSFRFPGCGGRAADPVDAEAP